MNAKTLWAAAWLALLTAIGAAVLTPLNRYTQGRLAENRADAWLHQLNEVIPAGSYDNDLARDAVTVNDPVLADNGPVQIWRARKNGVPVALAMEAVAPDGYDGPIRMIIGVGANGTLLGVRVLAHQETPGLGDRIDLKNGNWILGFNSKSLHNPPDQRWQARRDGGDIDQLSGATISSRAVIAAVHRALLYFESRRDTLFAHAP